MHNIWGLGIRRLLEGYPRGVLKVPHNTRPKFNLGYVRTLHQQEELRLLRDHLLRLDPGSRRDRFNGFMDDSFIEFYAAKCADDGTVIIAYIEDGVVRGAAELHSPDQSADALPEIASSVEASVRWQGVGSIPKKQPPRRRMEQLAKRSRAT